MRLRISSLLLVLMLFCCFLFCGQKAEIFQFAFGTFINHCKSETYGFSGSAQRLHDLGDESKLLPLWRQVSSFF